MRSAFNFTTPTVPDASHPLTSRGILIQSSPELSKWKCQLREGSPAKKLIIKTNDGLSRPSCREKHHTPALFLATGPLGGNHIFSFRIAPHPQFHASGKRSRNAFCFTEKSLQRLLGRVVSVSGRKGTAQLSSPSLARWTALRLELIDHSGEDEPDFCLDLVEMKISFPPLLKGPDRPGPQTIHSPTKINGSESLDHSEAVHLECLVPAPQRLQPSLR